MAQAGLAPELCLSFPGFVPTRPPGDRKGGPWGRRFSRGQHGRAGADGASNRPRREGAVARTIEQETSRMPLSGPVERGRNKLAVPACHDQSGREPSKMEPSRELRTVILTE